MEERVAGSEAAQLLEAVAATEQELAEAQGAVGAAQEKKKAMVAAAKVGEGLLLAPACWCLRHRPLPGLKWRQGGCLHSPG